jgi:hypothetical protein
VLGGFDIARHAQQLVALLRHGFNRCKPHDEMHNPAHQVLLVVLCVLVLRFSRHKHSKPRCKTLYSLRA